MPTLPVSWLFVASPILVALITAAISYYQDYLAHKNILSHEAACDKLLHCYEGTSGWLAAMDENIWIAGKLESTVYGEITYEGMRLLAEKLALTRHDVFYDLGSGTGKLVSYLYLTTPIKKSIGIEMVGQRNSIALWVKEKLRLAGLLDQRRELTFIHNNMRLEDFKGATVIYMASLCFADELMAALNQKFAQLNPGLRIISLRPIPPHPQIVFIERTYLPMTWTYRSIIYHYELIAP